jgi:uncharacterized lipoprotein YmbA
MKYFILMVALMLTGCSTTTATRFGYWLDRGSSTFQGTYQCVDTFKPHRNIECQ